MDFPRHIPFLQHLGCELERFDGGEAVITLNPEPAHANAFGMVHGGVLMTLLDAAMAHAARSTEKDPANAMGVVTIEMKTMFMRPSVGAVRVHGRLLHRTASTAFCEATVWVQDKTGGEVAAARSTGTFRFIGVERGKTIAARVGGGGGNGSD